jgi:hypothetical protein
MQWRRVGRIAATVLAGLVVPVAVGAVGAAQATSEIYTPRMPARRLPRSMQPLHQCMIQPSRLWRLC